MYVIVNRYSVDLSKVITDTLQTEEWAMNLKMLSLLSDHAEEPEFQMQWEQAAEAQIPLQWQDIRIHKQPRSSGSYPMSD